MAEDVTVINDTKTLEAYTKKWSKAKYITIDTEFIRERTYWPQLCLIQVGGPDESVIIDPLAHEINLDCLFSLINSSPVIKVFHAARQDLELFYHLTGLLPNPVFDTQIAASVCGFGDSVGYEKLANKLAGATIDKTLRFTDWSRRPLSDRQLRYAISDVLYLRPVYEKLSENLNQSGRHKWIDEEMSALTDINIYDIDPKLAWRKIRIRGGNPRFLAILREIAAWREIEAKSRNVPRGRIIRDEAITEIAAQAPTSLKEFSQIRSLSNKKTSKTISSKLINCVETAINLPEKDLPLPPLRREMPHGIGPIVDLLKVLLKTQCENNGVSQRIVASNSELEQIAALSGNEERSVISKIPALNGWRKEIFGKNALDLKDGNIALAIIQGKIDFISVDKLVQEEPKTG